MAEGVPMHGSTKSSGSPGPCLLVWLGMTLDSEEHNADSLMLSEASFVRIYIYIYILVD